MGKHDRAFQGMAWVSHLVPGYGRGGFRGLLCKFVVQDMGRGLGRNKDTRQSSRKTRQLVCNVHIRHVSRDIYVTLLVTRLPIVTPAHSFSFTHAK